MLKEPASGKHEAAYTTLAKIHNLCITKVIYKHAMESPITIMQRKLLLLSPEVCAQLADTTIRKHLSHDNPALVMTNKVPNPANDSYLQKFEEAQEKQMAYMLATFAATA
jgi:hypothetical protein